MIVGANWKPRKFSDDELDVIEKRGHGDFEELTAILCRCIARMSEQEKAEFRKGMLVSFEKRAKEIKDRKAGRVFTEPDRRFLRDLKINPDGDD